MQFTDSRVYDAPPSEVWAVVSDPDLYAEVAPNLSRVEVLDGEGEGMVRECADTDGNAWQETCTRWEPERGYAVTVHVPESEFHRQLFHTFTGEWDVTETDEGVRVTMTFEYDPRYGPIGWLLGRLLEREATGLTAAIFDGWEQALRERGALATGATAGAADG
jgi:uncharacterized protein YndB with AHSA1/START domain